MKPSEKLLYTRAEAAEMLSLSVSTLDVAIARGMLLARRNGRRVMIERREIEKFSRADHPRIWAEDGRRGTATEGRTCGDCAKSGRSTPATRFCGAWPVCEACFLIRRSAPRSVDARGAKRLAASLGDGATPSAPEACRSGTAPSTFPEAEA